MVSKKDVAILGIGLVVLVAASKQVGSFFGSVGTTVGSALNTGLQDFVSALTFGAVPSGGAGGGAMGQTMPGMTSNMMKPVIVGNVDTTGDVGGLIPGKVITDANGNPIDLTGGVKPFDLLGSIKNYILGGEKVTDIPLDPRATATGLTENSIDAFINMVTGAIKGSTKDVTFTTQSLNDIFKGAYDYLSKGSTNLSEFLQSYKFPSGETLSDVIGGGKGITPDAFGQTMTPQMMRVANLNIDNKVDTPYGVITYGGNPNSQGLGKGGILPAQNLTQVLQQHPELTASQAADLLFRMMGGMAKGFDFGSNTGSGYTNVLFSMPTKEMLVPMVLGLENNPVLKAYEAYKAMYGLM